MLGDVSFYGFEFDQDNFGIEGSIAKIGKGGLRAGVVAFFYEPAGSVISLASLNVEWGVGITFQDRSIHQP